MNSQGSFNEGKKKKKLRNLKCSDLRTTCGFGIQGSTRSDNVQQGIIWTSKPYITAGHKLFTWSMPDRNSVWL